MTSPTRLSAYRPPDSWAAYLGESWEGEEAAVWPAPHGCPPVVHQPAEELVLQPFRDVERVRHLHRAETPVDGVLPGITLQIEEEYMSCRQYFLLKGGCYTLKGGCYTLKCCSYTPNLTKLSVKLVLHFLGFS